MGELDIRLKNIETCMSKGDYESAVTIASKIKDPRRIKDVDQILMLAELYHRVKEVPNHDEISSELYDLAYAKAPNSKNVILAAFDFNVKRKDPINALRYFDLFRRLETDEAEICIARHKYYVAIGAVSNEEMIENLERLKEIRHIEQWEYALARLYKKAGYVEKCISECDEIFAWFHKGQYVTKALELKMEFEPLSKTQQYQYDMRFYANEEDDVVQGAKANMEQMAPKEEKRADDIDEIQINLLGQTGDLQDMIKSNLRELYGDDDMNDDSAAIGRTGDLYKNILNKNTSEIERMNEEFENNVMIGRTAGFGTEPIEAAEDLGSTRVFPPVGTRVNPPRRQQLEPREEVYHGTIPFDASEVIMEDDSSIGNTSELLQSLREDEDNSKLNNFKEEFKRSAGMNSSASDDDLDAEFDLDKFPSEAEIAKSQKLAAIKDLEETQNLVSSFAEEDEAEVLPKESYRNAYGEVGNYIYQNEDGQLSLSHITAEEIVEKQITGQMNIKEFLDNWNNAKDEKENERQERFKARMLEETGSLMSTIDMTVPIMDTELDERLLTKSGSEEAVEEYRKVINPDIISSKEELDEIMAKEEAAESEEASAEAEEALDEAFKEAIPEAAAEVINEEIIEEAADIEAEETAEEAASEAVEEAAAEDISETLEDELDAIIAEAIEAEEEIEAEVKEEALEESLEETAEAAETVEEAVEEVSEEAEEVVEAEEAPAETEAVEETAEAAAEVKAASSEGSIWEEVEGKKKPEAKAEEPAEEAEESDQAEESEETEEQTAIQGALSDDERKLFAPFLYSKTMKKQIIESLEKLTLAAYVGNLIITADESKDASDLARLFALYAKESDSNFTGNVAIIDSEKFNNKDIKSIFNKLTNGALIIERANKLTSASINTFLKELNQEEAGIVAVLTDTKTEMRFLLDRAPILTQFFDGRVDVISKTTKMLVKYGVQYAQSKGYVIDSMAELAFNKRIDDLKKGNHNVTIGEVKEIVDEAIKRATKGLFKFSKKDERGNIILREKDFN